MTEYVEVQREHDATGEVTFVSDNENIVRVNGTEFVPSGQYGSTTVRAVNTDGKTVWTGIIDVYVDGRIAAPKVYAGKNFSVALQVSGKVYAWGENTQNQLGDGTDKSKASPVAVQFGGDSTMLGIRDISASDTHVLMVTESMEVMSWGGNEHGQLGSMNKDNRSKAYYVYEDEYESILSDIISVAAGSSHSLALTKDGYV